MRDARLRRLGQRGERVREARAVGRRRGGEAARGAEVRIGGDDPAGLVTHRRVARRRAVEGVEEQALPLPITPKTWSMWAESVCATSAETVGMAESIRDV